MMCTKERKGGTPYNGLNKVRREQEGFGDFGDWVCRDRGRGKEKNGCRSVLGAVIGVKGKIYVKSGMDILFSKGVGLENMRRKKWEKEKSLKE